MEVMAERGDVRVVLDDDCGEGIEGDYRPDDPNDVPLMRFTVYKRGPVGDPPIPGEEFFALENASYCTQIDTRLPKKELRRLVKLLLNEVYEPAHDHGNIKKLCERLSWINTTWGTKDEKLGWVLG